MDTLSRLLKKTQGQTVVARDPGSNEAAKKNSLLYDIPKEKRIEIGQKALRDLPAVSRTKDGKPGIVQLSKLLDMKREPTRSWKQEERVFKVENEDADAETEVYLESMSGPSDKSLSNTPFDALSTRLAAVSLEQQGAWGGSFQVGYALDDESSVTASASESDEAFESDAVSVDKSLVLVRPPETTYSLLSTSAWEDGIRWDAGSSDDDEGENEKDDGRTVEEAHKVDVGGQVDVSTAPKEPDKSDSGKPVLEAPKLQRAQSLNLEDMDVEWEDDQQAPPAMSSKEPGTQNKDDKASDRVDADGKTVGALARSWDLRKDEDKANLALVANLNNPILEKNIQSIQNRELCNGEWIKCIVWDDTKPPERKLDVRLILDQNDVNMNLTEGSSARPRQTTVAVRHDIFSSSWAGANELSAEVRKLLQKPKSEMSIVERRKFASVQRTLNLRQQGLFHWQEGIDGGENSDSDNSDEDGDDTKSNVQWELRLPKLRHSIPGQRFIGTKTELNPEEIRVLHKPRTKYKEGDTYFILTPPPNLEVGVRESAGGVNGQVRTLKKQDLSTLDGSVVLVEYSEKQPCFMNNFGMASNVANFYALEETPEPGFKGPQLPFGKTIVLLPGEKSPFMATVEKQRVYSAITNKMYTAPLFVHKTNSCDFLLVRAKDRRDRVTIRRIDNLFVVGQQEPNREVFTPNTYAKAGYTDFLHDFMAYHIVKRFTKSGRTTLHALHDMFPRVNSTYLRKVVKSVADKVKGAAGGGAQWEKLATAGSVDDFRKKVVPEDVCCYESVQVGLQVMYDAGIYRVCKENVTKVLQALQTLERQRLLSAQSEAAIREGLLGPPSKPSAKGKPKSSSIVVLPPKAQRFLNCARFVVDKLQLTPWHVTSCFINIFRRAGQSSNKFVGTKMRLTGIGDPSGRGEAISYLPEIEDDLTRKKRSKRGGGRPSTKSNVSTNTGYGGTDSDLRKLSMEGQAEVLRKIGYSRAKILSLGRWDRNLIIKNYASTKHGATAFGGALAKYSRNAHRTNSSSDPAEVVLTPYQKSINQIFERQLRVLADVDPPQPEVAERSDRLPTAPAAARPASKVGPSAIAGDRSTTEPKEDETAKLARMIEEFHKETAAKAKEEGVKPSGGGGRGSGGALTVQEKAEQAELNRLKDDIIREDGDENQSNTKSDSKSGGDAGSENRTVVPPPGWKPYQVLKRVLIKRLPNGETHAVVEYLKDPQRIKQYKEEVKSKRQKAKEEQEFFVKLELGLRQSPEDLAEGMKLRDKQRAQKKFEKSTKEGLRRLQWYEDMVKKKGPDFVFDLPEEKRKGHRCKRCRIKGHSAKNVKCPLYMKGYEENKAVKPKGLKLVVDRGHVNKKVAEKKREDMMKRKRSEVSQAGSRLERKRKKQYLEQEASARAKVEKKAGRGRARTPKSRLNLLFRDVVEGFLNNQDYMPFWSPVRKKDYPTYHQIVKTPMDLHKIKKRTMTSSYHTRHELLADFEQIFANSLLFNDPGKDQDSHDLSPISSAAQRMLEECRSEFSLRDIDVGNLEAEIAGNPVQVPQPSPVPEMATPAAGDIGTAKVSSLGGNGGGLLSSDHEQFGGLADSELLTGVYGDVGNFNLPASSPAPAPSPGGFQFAGEEEEAVWGGMANPFGMFNYGEGGMPEGSPAASADGVFEHLTKEVTAMSPDADLPEDGENAQGENDHTAEDVELVDEEEYGNLQDMDDIDLENFSEFEGEEMLLDEDAEVIEEGNLEVMEEGNLEEMEEGNLEVMEEGNLEEMEEGNLEVMEEGNLEEMEEGNLEVMEEGAIE